MSGFEGQANAAFLYAHIGTQEWSSSDARIFLLAEQFARWQPTVSRTRQVEHGWSLAIAGSIGTGASPERVLYRAGEQRLEELATGARRSMVAKRPTPPPEKKAAAND